jgi:rare lipoprotein A
MSQIKIYISAFLFLGLLSCATSNLSDKKSVYQSGKASWYGEKYHGRKTASGEKYNMNAMTAAHKKLPFGTKVKVTSKINGQSVVVRINDRGPFAKSRIIDVSKAAAKKLGMIQKGEIPVTIIVL